jgi:hypothetical protein
MMQYKTVSSWGQPIRVVTFKHKKYGWMTTLLDVWDNPIEGWACRHVCWVDAYWFHYIHLKWR